MIKKYLHFKAETMRQSYNLTSIKIDIPEDLFSQSILLNCYIQGIIYDLITRDNNKKIFIKIIDYKLTDIK